MHINIKIYMLAHIYAYAFLPRCRREISITLRILTECLGRLPPWSRISWMNWVLKSFGEKWQSSRWPRVWRHFLSFFFFVLNILLKHFTYFIIILIIFRWFGQRGWHKRIPRVLLKGPSKSVIWIRRQQVISSGCLRASMCVLFRVFLSGVETKAKQDTSPSFL